MLVGGCVEAVRLRPELRAPALRRDALALSDALERLIDEGRATPGDREAAYEAVRAWQADSAEYAFVRAALAGRLAEVRGITAVGLVREMETWGHLSLKRDPAWNGGAARRLLGTMYVLAPGSILQRGSSEDGIALLETQAAEHPSDSVNRLRLAEGYVTLNDAALATGHLCFVLAHEKQLRPTDGALLRSLLEQVGGRVALRCP